MVPLNDRFEVQRTMLSTITVPTATMQFARVNWNATNYYEIVRNRWNNRPGTKSEWTWRSANYDTAIRRWSTECSELINVEMT